MDKKILNFFRKWFIEYVSSFYKIEDIDIQNIKLKEEHTKRVCQESLLISKALELNEHDLMIAETIALFHDIGRFKQLKEFKTYKDWESVNHAELGVEILNEYKILDECNDLDKETICTAIKFHNLPLLTENHVSPTSLFFLKLIRDADKLDILQILVSYYAIGIKDPNSFLDLGLKDDGTFNPLIITKLKKRIIPAKEDIHSLNDYKLLQISWVFDINFKPTLLEIKKREYIEKLIATLPYELRKNDFLKQIIKNI